MALSGKQFTVSAGDFEATISEVGAGLRRFTFRGVDVTVPVSPDVLPAKGSGAVLVPWPNRIRHGRYRFGGEQYQLSLTEPELNNAIHGLARWARWMPSVEQAARVTLVQNIVPQTGYPFEVAVEVTY